MLCQAMPNVTAMVDALSMASVQLVAETLSRLSAPLLPTVQSDLTCCLTLCRQVRCRLWRPPCRGLTLRCWPGALDGMRAVGARRAVGNGSQLSQSLALSMADMPSAAGGGLLTSEAQSVVSQLLMGNVLLWGLEHS